jgi:glycosyltransferase involved in cell wall biosynthesis
MRTSTPWLSILIPVYNVEAYLNDCLDSIAQQYQPGIEIIALDDCSTDNSALCLQQWADTHAIKINILKHPKNRGLSAARNTMLAAAQGEYIWFVDSDDALEPGSIDQLRTIVDQHQPDLVLCDYRVWRSRQALKHKWRGENHVRTFAGPKNTLSTDPLQLFEGIYKQGYLHVWSKIAKRSLWADDLRFPEGKVMEDIVVTPQLMLRARSYFYMPEVWVAYRKRAGSILTTWNQKKIDDMASACKGVLSAWISAHPQLPPRARFYFGHYCLRIHLSVVRNLRRLHKNPHIDISHYRQLFIENMGDEKINFYWEYFKRGWFVRLARLKSDY